MFLVDGYNLIFSLIKSKESLQTLRQKVIHYLQRKFAAKKISGLIVFDGAHRKDEESGLSYSSPLTIAYAPKGQSADEYIVEQIQLAKNPKQLTVITNDRGLTLHAKSAGAKVQTNAEFIDWLKKKKRQTEPSVIKDTPQNIERLEKIFEERLKRELEE